MIWLSLAVIVAIAYAAQGLCSKRLLEAHPESRVRCLLFAVATPLLLAYLAVRGLPDVRPAFWPILALSVAGGAVSFWLFMRALRLTDLSIAYPLISLTPLVMIPVELVLLGDLPGLQGLLGVIAIVAGVYVLNLKSRQTSWLDPFRAVLRDRGALFALGLAVVWAVTGVVDKLAIRYSSPALYAPLMSASIALVFAPAAWRARRRSPGPPTGQEPGSRGSEDRVTGERQKRSSRWGSERSPLGASGPLLFFLQGLFFALMIVAQYEAIRLTLVSYVISIKRSGTLIGVVFGYLFLGEEEFHFRIAGALIIVVGILLLALG